MIDAIAAPTPNYVTKGLVLDVYDGDTITVLRDLGHNIHFQTRFRIIGIDTPERRGVEKPWGLISREHIVQLIAQTTEWRVFKTPWGENKFPVLIMRSVKPDKYGGRWLGEIWRPDDKQQINLQMVEDGFARLYDGGKKSAYPVSELAVQPKDAE